MPSKPTLLVTRKLPEAVEARASRDYKARLNVADEPLDGDGILRAAAGADAVLCTTTDRLDAATIAKLPNSVRILATFSVGFEHIDLKAARARGIVVTNTPDVLTDATADIAMLLMLGAARRASEGERLIRSDGWTGWAPTHMLGSHLGGKRLGILGMGRIGRAVAQRARAFGMVVHYHNRQRLALEDEQGAIFHETPESLLPSSDILSIHCPLTQETRHFVDKRRIELLPLGAIVVNTARGGLIDEDALADALDSGHLRGTALDVYVGEFEHPPPARLWSNPRVLITPHTSSISDADRHGSIDLFCENLRAYLAGRELRNVIDWARGY